MAISRLHGVSEIRVVDPAADTAWDTMAASHPEATVFHSAAWARVLTDTYHHKPFYIWSKCDGETAAMLPLMEVSSSITGKRGVSLPFSDFCPPLIFNKSQMSGITEKLTELAADRKWKHFELREAPFLRTGAPSVVRFRGHRLDLAPGPERLLANVSSNVRRNLRKAERSGVTVRALHTREATLQFYKLHVRTRRRHALPPQSRAFFLNIHRHLIGPGRGMIVLAHKGAQCVAGAVFFQFGENVVYKYGASDERFQEFRANNLVMWEAIRSFSESGAHKLHFGRTSLENEGLRRFKLGWGAVEGPIDYFRFESATKKWATSESDLAARAGKLFARLPMTLNRLIGTMVYPHLD